MIYEFIATATAAFGMAGLALIIKHLAKLAGYRAPKWIIPIFAAIGIFAFQIHQEYNWFEQKSAKLPENVVVIKKVEDSAWFRPWSYIKPQTVRFMAADLRKIKSHPSNPDIKLVNLYLFGRRMSVQKVPQLINCHDKTQADYSIPTPKTAASTNDNEVTTTTDTPTESDVATLTWLEMPEDDPLLQVVCA